MANFFHRSSLDGFTGSGYPISGLGNYFTSHSNPFGFEYFFNLMFFRLKKLLASDLFLTPYCIFPKSVPQFHFQETWSPKDIADLTSTSKFLLSRLQLWFPLSSLPKFPLLTHPPALKLFLSSLFSRFHFLSPVPAPHLHPHCSFILASLKKLVVIIRSHSFYPIVSLSLPPCSSVSDFVTQISFLAHLVPLPPSTCADTPGLGSFSTTGPRPGPQVHASPSLNSKYAPARSSALRTKAAGNAAVRPCQARDAEVVLALSSTTDEAEANAGGFVAATRHGADASADAAAVQVGAGVFGAVAAEVAADVAADVAGLVDGAVVGDVACAVAGAGAGAGAEAVAGDAFAAFF